MDETVFLKPDTILNSRYRILKHVQESGYYITYEALDITTNNIVLVEEFFLKGWNFRINNGNVEVFKGKRLEDFKEGLRKFSEHQKWFNQFNDVEGIINLIDFFTENNTAYSVKPILKGKYISEYKGLWSLDNAVHIIKTVGNAIASIHREGYLYLDCRPSGIFICDNGIIKLTCYDRIRRITEKKKISPIFEPAYSAPEEYYQRACVQSDIYSVGAVMYKMLTGRRPQDSCDRLKSDMLANPISINPNVPEYIDRAIMKAMQPKTAKRYKDMQKFMDDLYIAPKVPYNQLQYETTTVYAAPGETDVSYKLNRPYPYSFDINETSDLGYLISNSDGKQYAITKTPYFIGRAPDKTNCCIRHNIMVSRIHACIVFYGGRLCIKDNNSTNGTYLNGKKLNHEDIRPLSDGDIIIFGDEKFEFHT